MKFGFVDFETTGLDAEIDEIIEVGITMVDYEDLDKPGMVTDIFGGFRDTDIPISEEAFGVHGITKELISGRKLPMDYLRSITNGASYMIAHNAPFDYQMAVHSDDLAWLGEFKWLCSIRHIPWADMGHKTRVLTHLASDLGFVNPFAHRAAMDTLTDLRVVDGKLRDMIETSEADIITIKIYNTLFSPTNTALLKSMGCRWYPADSLDSKHWWVETTPEKARAYYEGPLKELYDAEWKFKKNLDYSSVTWEEYIKNYKTV